MNLLFKLKNKNCRRVLKGGGSMKTLSKEFKKPLVGLKKRNCFFKLKKPLVGFLSLCFLFICSYTYGLGYLEAVSAAAIKGKAASNEAGYLNKTKNRAECNIQYQQAQQKYKDCTFKEALSPPASGVSECVAPSPPNCN